MTKLFALGAALFLVAVCGAAAQAQDKNKSPVTEDAYRKMQVEFAAAYNAKDTAAMAAFFAEDAIRITPTGVFRGRDAIRRDMDKAIALGIHDYSVERTVSRPYDNVTFNAGEWKAKIGDQAFHGYYSALVTLEGGAVKILEETVNVATPRK